MTLIFLEATATFEKLQLGCNMSLEGVSDVAWLLAAAGCWLGDLAVGGWWMVGGMYRLVIVCVCFWVKHMLCYSYSDSVTLYFAQCTVNEQRARGRLQLK